jgi:hypothetical protein
MRNARAERNAAAESAAIRPAVLDFAAAGIDDEFGVVVDRACFDRRPTDLPDCQLTSTTFASPGAFSPRS